MDLETMSPAIVAKLLEGHNSTLTELIEEREQFYAKQHCPRCDGAEHAKQADARRVFASDDGLPRFQLRCLNCGCEWDPFTGLIEKLGNLANAFEPAVPLIRKED